VEPSVKGNDLQTIKIFYSRMGANGEEDDVPLDTYTGSSMTVRSPSPVYIWREARYDQIASNRTWISLYFKEQISQIQLFMCVKQPTDTSQSAGSTRVSLSARWKSGLPLA